MVSIVYMVAGMSSRFGGKIKQFAKVGKNDETLIEVSINQAIDAGFDKIVFIVGEKTSAPFKEMFGNNYQGIPISYATQTFDKELRDKPWGTTDALISAKNVIDSDFVVCNGDDLYGENSFKLAINFLKENNCGVAIGYQLEQVIPNKGTVNRGLFKTDKNNFVTNLEEVFDISKDNLLEKKLIKTDLCSMNLFGFKKEILPDLEKILINFKQINKDDRKIECLLPTDLCTLINENKLKIKLIPTNDKWFGVTNPEDEEIIRKQLKAL